MKLFEIDQAIMDCVNEDGEVIDVDRLNELEMERDTKIESVCLWKKDLEAEAKAIDEEIKKLQARKKADENKIESLKGWVKYAVSSGKHRGCRYHTGVQHRLYSMGM